MLEVFILAVALSMDAFAVSIGLGAKKYPSIPFLGIKVAVLFGFFQGLMPLVGYFAGVGAGEFIASFDHWIAFVLLGGIGVKMMMESRQEDTTEEICTLSHKILFTLAVATSIDAMAAGFTLNLFDLSVGLSVVLIGVVTFIFSYAGVLVGQKSGVWLESRAEFFGGLVLVLIGLKILLEHLFFEA